ncbi:MAG: hypothetical protein E6Q91_03860 [Actinobacteria bacterium]|nr:MAG: hypothetical protein E6Q91_03860 [Actinomycetota bacterium]
MRHRPLGAATLAIPALTLVAACSGGQQSYSSTAEFIAAMDEAGYTCTDPEEVQGLNPRVECDGGSVMFQVAETGKKPNACAYIAGAYIQNYVSAWQSGGPSAPYERLIKQQAMVGENWVMYPGGESWPPELDFQKVLDSLGGQSITVQELCDYPDNLSDFPK